MTRTLDTAKAAFQQALTLLRAGDAAGAESEARAALAQYPDEPNFLAVLGTALNRLHRGAEAEPLLRRAIELDPGYAKAHEALEKVLPQWRAENRNKHPRGYYKRIFSGPFSQITPLEYDFLR